MTTMYLGMIYSINSELRARPINYFIHMRCCGFLTEQIKGEMKRTSEKEQRWNSEKSSVSNELNLTITFIIIAAKSKSLQYTMTLISSLFDSFLILKAKVVLSHVCILY